jgi:hypothetical protein
VKDEEEAEELLCTQETYREALIVLKGKDSLIHEFTKITNSESYKRGLFFSLILFQFSDFPRCKKQHGEAFMILEGMIH